MKAGGPWAARLTRLFEYCLGNPRLFYEALGNPRISLKREAILQSVS